MGNEVSAPVVNAAAPKSALKKKVINNGDHHRVVNPPAHNGKNHSGNSAAYDEDEDDYNVFNTGSASVGFEVDYNNDDDNDTTSDEDASFFFNLQSIMSKDTTKSLMEASAAIFQVLAEQDTTDGETTDGEGYSVGTNDCSYTVSDRSAAVFRFLDKESRRPDPSDSILSFLETASVVSSILKQQQQYGADDATTISQASAAVFRMLEHTNEDEEDNDYSSVMSAAIFKLLDEGQSVVGNNNNNNNYGDDAKSIFSVSDRSAAVFHILDDAKSMDAHSISEFSSAVFHMLREAKSGDTNRRQNKTNNHVVSFFEQQQAFADGRSISDQSATIFKMLDNPIHRLAIARNRRGGRLAPTPESSQRQGQPHHLSPNGSLATRPTSNNNYHHSRGGREATIPEEPYSVSSYDQERPYLNVAARQREDYPEVDNLQKKTTNTQHQELQPEQPTWGTTSGEDSDEEEEEDIDLEFVENFDSAFNEFISQNPKFLMNNPDLVHSLRVTKLQKLLEFQDAYEADLLEQLAYSKSQKSNLELEYHQKLREASRKKAAREINLQSDLDRLNLSTKLMEAKLTWQMVTLSEQRAKKQIRLVQKYKQQQQLAGVVVSENTRQEWSQQVPTGPDGQAVRDAILAPPTGALSEEQEKDLVQFQVDNAFLSSEVTVMTKKLDYQKAFAKKHAWVESILLRVNAETMDKLKDRYQKKTGAMF
jgi:hypothetical protein